ncbi:MAG: hypothetical protein NWE93_02890 [Candidatus Bathyarchaeota archaeon]|nr:hypothetical protein [Candidatus Bathyarchaeota archaeon]
MQKCIVKVVLSKEQKNILAALSKKLGTSESEMMRWAMLDYAKEVNLVKHAPRCRKCS